MKKYLFGTFTVVIATAFSLNAVAQTEDSKPAKRPAIKAGPAACGCCAEGGASQTSPVILALDLDKDGRISSLEIKNAVQSLSALDADGDGQINREEMHAKSEFSQVNASTSPQNPTQNRSKLQLGMTPEKYVALMMYKYDLDKNGKIEKSEMTPRVSAFLKYMDSNNDEVLTADELLTINEQIKADYTRTLEKKRALRKSRASTTRVRNSNQAAKKARGNR